MIVTKRVEGEVEFNDGEFAEIQTYGIEGIEKDLLLKTIQIHRNDTDDTSDEFQRRLPVGAVLEITTTTELTIHWKPPMYINSSPPKQPTYALCVRRPTH